MVFAFTVLSAPLETPWEALRHLPKHHIYTVLKYDGACLTGSFSATSNDQFVLSVPQLGDKSIPRVDVLRIAAGDSVDLQRDAGVVGAGNIKAQVQRVVHAYVST